ncbi:hypothetical protein RAD15_19085 [Bradyrhizobium sp. 14AA]
MVARARQDYFWLTAHHGLSQIMICVHLSSGRKAVNYQILPFHKPKTGEFIEEGSEVRISPISSTERPGTAIAIRLFLIVCCARAAVAEVAAAAASVMNSRRLISSILYKQAVS